VLRLAVGAPLTEERHIIAAWKVLQEKATALLEGDNVTRPKKPNGHCQLPIKPNRVAEQDSELTTEQNGHVDDLSIQSQ